MYKIIKTHADYEKALKKVERLIDLDPEPGTEAGDQLELLTLIIHHYEEESFPMENPDPVDAICFRMEQQGLMEEDLIPYIGSRHEVAEVVSRKRPLTLKMIRALNKGLNIPAEVLLQEVKYISAAA